MPYVDYTYPDAGWGYTASGGIHRLSSPSYAWITFQSNNYAYKQDKNYQIVTSFYNDATTFGSTISFILNSPFSTSVNTFTHSFSINASTVGGARTYLYASPISNGNSNAILQIGANSDLNAYNKGGGNFPKRIIKRCDIYEIDFYINGQRTVATGINTNPSYGLSTTPRGWYYNNLDNSYWWNWSSSGLNPTYSTFGSGLSSVRTYNFIAKRIEYDYVNLQFTYATFSGNSSDGITIYLGTDLSNQGTWQSIGVLKGMSQSSVTHQLLGLTGTNTNGTKNYLIITASQSVASSYTGRISNIQIYGGYHPFNNDQFLFTNSSNYYQPTTLQIIGLSNATYSFISGWGSTITNTFSNASLVKSKMGNGLFKSGIWENGVWNNGWRDDENAKDFDDIIFSIATLRGIRWRIQLVGPEDSVSNFNIGDRISIGNIIGIDINEERKIFRGIFTIIRKNDESIIIEANTTFPFRRIEKDSPNHKIKVTKNIWLSGAFLNGYFTGVWNSGLFKGLPYSTEMYDTHWIDGKFDGGHLNSNYPYASFNDTYYIVASDWGLDTSYEGKLGLTFSTGHPYVAGDWIIIDKNDKSMNPDYDGSAQILEVIDEHLIILDKKFGGSSNMESGFTYRWTATSVLQNLTFYDNNRSKRTSNQSSVSADVFSFNSWLDLNYDPTRSVSIARQSREFDEVTAKSVNKTNLYGYPTYDILSSDSWFRDSHTTQQKSYKLGTKYKIYEDPIGDGSYFTEPFEPQIFTDEIVLRFNKKRRNSSGSAIPFETSAQFTLIVVPLQTSRFNYSDPTLICQVIEDSDPLIMAQLVANNISNGYTASYSRNIVTIKDIDGNSFGTKGLDIDGSNYALMSDSSAGGLTVIYPSQRVSQYSTPRELANNRGDAATPIDERIITRSLAIDQESIRFGRVIEGVGYGNLTDAGWQITQASFSNSDIRRTQESETDENIRGEEMQINVIRNGVTLNNNNIQIDSNRYTIVEFDIMSYSISNEFYKFSNSDLTYTRRGILTEQTVNFPIVHLSNLNYDYVNSRSGISRYDNLRFITEVNKQYLPLTYLPIKDNINHLFTENTFRLDSVETISPDKYGGYGQNKPTKKYEYFYSKRDLQLKVLGNGLMGASPSSVILDNIKMYEVDMIPFFQYFKIDNIYKGVQIPYQGRAPKINYSDADFEFLDNVSIGMDSINIEQTLAAVTNTIGGIASVPQPRTIRPTRILTTPTLLFDAETISKPGKRLDPPMLELPLPNEFGTPVSIENSSRNIDS